ncbi:hypothetical protein LMG28727_04869 [Paraburkholderia kirstenboschensis]|uniref:hypothetical protein n=1 Tax=Paraburkholderia kirstenboschensis TaxID=1245436 RepID=UPI000AC35A2D|nr:hypothetical protein [Paraburkholderia kirstenboschensis]CAD6548646.1 hypothetical protein LMG28727_04869 [Paraburkholderia kirstenboschensis]
MTTAADLITLALKDIGALGVGQAVSAEDTADALATLNMMLGQWAAERLSVYHLVDTAKQSTGAQSYTVGIGGDFNVARPIKINAAYARLTSSGAGSAVDYRINMIDAREDYARISLKTLSSFPEWAFYDSAFPLGNLFLYPVPNSSYELHIVTMDTLPQFSAAGTVVSLPAPYMAAIRYNLGIYLCPSYQLEPTPSLVRLAMNAKRVIKRMNNQIPQLTMPRGLMSKSRYNIYSDTESN